MGTPQGSGGPWGGDTSPSTRSLGGRKWRRVDHSFPPHLSAWPAPPPAGPAWKRWAQALAHAGRPASSIHVAAAFPWKRRVGQFPLSAWPPLGLWFWEFTFPFSFLSLFNIRL